MQLDLYQVDAFADRVFTGNPAAVCPLQEWLDDDLMQSIAAENNLAETAFFVPRGDDFQIRWFTPEVEVDLCGHATLASAWVLFNRLDYNAEKITFHSRSGPLIVTRGTDQLVMDFPSQVAVACDVPDGLLEALGVSESDAVQACLYNEDYVLVLQDEQQLRGLNPDFSMLKKVKARGVIVTSTASDYDFINRFFGPQVGIDEDPVTGSAFTKLAPYWGERLHKTQMSAKQVSQRGGEVSVGLQGDRVTIAGQAVCYMHARITV